MSWLETEDNDSVWRDKIAAGYMLNPNGEDWYDPGNGRMGCAKPVYDRFARMSPNAVLSMDLLLGADRFAQGDRVDSGRIVRC